MPEIVLSTGVRENIAGNTARVEVVNLDPSSTRTVTVKLFDWGPGPGPSAPKPVPVNPSGAIALGAQVNQSFIASLIQLKRYEIRITLSDADDVVANCFEIDSNSHYISTVPHAELVEIGGGVTAGWWTNAETFGIGAFALPTTYANGVYDWAGLAESKVTFVTHCPVDKDFIARCHSLGVRCFPYVVFYCGSDQVFFRTGSSPNGAPVLPISDTYEGVNFGGHPEYFEYEPDPQHPGQYRPRPWMFGNVSDGVGVFFSNPLVTCPNMQGYQDAMVKWVDYVMKQGADGVFVDVMVKRSHCDGPAAGKHAHIVAEVPNDPDAAQNHAYAALLKRVRGVVKRHRADGLVLGNSGDPLNLIGNSPPEFQQYIDADMLEGYICQAGQNQIVRVPTYQAGQTWDQLGRLLQPYMAGGKQVLAISPIGQPSANIPREDAFFCYASARLAGITWYGAMTDPTVADLFRVRLGKPLTAELQEPLNAAPPACVFYRVFERALVAVNPDPASERLLSIHPSVPTVRFYDLFAHASVDATASGALRIPANSGRVFLFGSTTSFGLNLPL